MIAGFLGLLALGAQTLTAPTASSGRWNLKVDLARCSLERRTIEPATTLSIETTPGSDVYRIAIAADNLGKTASLMPGSLTFAPSQKERNGLTSVTKLPNSLQQIIWMDGLGPETLDDLATADRVTITSKSSAMGSVPVKSAAKAIDAVRHCNADQLTEWGADAKQFANDGKLPKALKDRDQWLSNDELLAVAAQSSLANLNALFRVSISISGEIDNCSPVDSSVEPGVQKRVCAAVMGKTLFKPAQDGSGKAVRGVATFRVVLYRR